LDEDVDEDAEEEELDALADELLAPESLLAALALDPLFAESDLLSALASAFAPSDLAESLLADSADDDVERLSLR
jgi:hypothetical protein